MACFLSSIFMTTMPIRQHRPPTEEFVEEFQSNLVPSAIPSSDFIDWKRIDEYIEDHENQIQAVADLRGVSEETFVSDVADTLMRAEDTRKLIDFYFELLGERGNKYSALEGVWKFYDVQRAIDSGDREAARDLAEVLHEVGLQRLVDSSTAVRDHFRGMLVGMETHSRKNRQGTCFENVVGERIETITDRLNEAGYAASMDDEYITGYEDDSGQTKTVDFALFEDGDLRVVFEANCYKTGGSKPSEIRRSYNYVAQRMRDDGRAFVWITDGQAWEKSLSNVLRESYEDTLGIYNLHQTEEYLFDDVLNFFETGEV